MRKPVFHLVSRNLLRVPIVGTGSIGRNPPDVPVAGAVGVEVDPLAVVRIVGTVVIAGVGIELLRFAAGGGNAEDIVISGTAVGSGMLQHIGQILSVR